MTMKHGLWLRWICKVWVQGTGKYYGSVVEQEIPRIIADQELRELYKDLDIVAGIQRRDWNGMDI
jgi:hypothetical protein